MQIKIDIDISLTPRAKRALKWIALPFALFAGAIGVAHAYDTSWIQPGRQVSATTLRANLDEIQTRLTPVGTIVAYAGPGPAPMGWLLCDGSAVSRTGQTAALFLAIGTVWGSGDNITTFNLPDLRARTPIGAGTGSGLTTPRTIGTLLGEESHLLTIAEMPAHSHTGMTLPFDANHTHRTPTNQNPGTATVGAQTQGGISGAVGASSLDSFSSSGTGAFNLNHTHGIPSEGGSQAFPIMPPSAVVNYIIKL